MNFKALRPLSVVLFDRSVDDGIVNGRVCLVTKILAKDNTSRTCEGLDVFTGDIITNAFRPTEPITWPSLTITGYTVDDGCLISDDEVLTEIKIPDDYVDGDVVGLLAATWGTQIRQGVALPHVLKALPEPEKQSTKA